MSRKIYNEIILQWNDKTQSFDTLSEDSYIYECDVYEAMGRKSCKQIMKEFGDKVEWRTVVVSVCAFIAVEMLLEVYIFQPGVRRIVDEELEKRGYE